MVKPGIYVSAKASAGALLPNLGKNGIWKFKPLGGGEMT